jgi:hypothetical protein
MGGRVSAAEMITDKADMYRRLAAGQFGNTTPQYFSVAEWHASGDADRYQFWGVRSAKTSAHPACRLYCPAAEVVEYAARHFPDGPNISMMVDAVATVTAWLEIWDSPAGLVVEGIEWPRLADGWNWRNSMKNPQRSRRWEGTAARMVLARHLNANSLGDLHELFERFPGHVLELSALDRCLGMRPHRNAIVWEVRMY